MWRVIQGNALDVLKTLESESVHCCVTSPPYWGLRSYLKDDDPRKPYELGNEPTPEEYVAHMVEVFREVRRVLRKEGTLWLILGDSFAHPNKGGPWDEGRTQKGTGHVLYEKQANRGKLPGLKPKDLCMIPAEVAIALRNDGWYLRSAPPWLKGNAMPESVEDRPATGHEVVFLLTKSRHCFYDAEAVRKPYSPSSNADEVYTGQGIKDYEAAGVQNPSDTKRRVLDSMKRHSGRNRRTSDWWIESLDLLIEDYKQYLAHLEHVRRNGGLLLARDGSPLGFLVNTQPFRGAHFATFPPALVEPMILAGTSAAGVCAKCGAPWVRAVQRDKIGQLRPMTQTAGRHPRREVSPGQMDVSEKTTLNWVFETTTVGWRPTCSCGGEPVPATVLDPFAGAGTTLYVAEKLGRNSIGIELNPSYIEDIIRPRMAEIQYVEHELFA